MWGSNEDPQFVSVWDSKTIYKQKSVVALWRDRCSSTVITEHTGEGHKWKRSQFSRSTFGSFPFVPSPAVRYALPSYRARAIT